MSAGQKRVPNPSRSSFLLDIADSLFWMILTHTQGLLAVTLFLPTQLCPQSLWLKVDNDNNLS